MGETSFLDESVSLGHLSRAPKVLILGIVVYPFRSLMQSFLQTQNTLNRHRLLSSWNQTVLMNRPLHRILCIFCMLSLAQVDVLLLSAESKQSLGEGAQVVEGHPS